MSQIREKRKLVINRKRVTPTVIRNIASLIDEETKSLSNDTSKMLLVFSVDATDNSSYESQSTSIFDQNELIERKVVEKINMRFNLLDFSKSIEIQLKQSDDETSKESFIIVSGENSVWVNGIMAKFTEILDLTETQPKVKNIIDWTVFGCMVIFNVLYFRLLYAPLKSFFTGVIFDLIFIIGIPFASIFLFGSISTYLKQLWPAIEIQTGPNHAQITARNRQKVIQICLIVIIPLVLAVLYDIAKTFIMK